MSSEGSRTEIVREMVRDLLVPSSEQAQVGCPLQGLRPRRHSELLVDRPEVAFHRVAGNVESGGDLQVGVSRQELEDTQLGSSQRFGEHATLPGDGRLYGAYLQGCGDQLLGERVRR